MATDVGVVRDHNEDAAFVDAGSQFFIVADGMGGHAAGEVASAMAVETVKETLEGARGRVNAFARQPTEDGRRELVQLLQSAVLAAHQAVYQRGSRESDKQGMGTTLDVLLIAGAEAFVAHVGDSRTYLIRDGRASQITTDHTVAEVLVIEGKLTVEEAQVSPLRTILVNAIGVSADVGVEMAHLQLRAGDRLLLCSDGLHDYFVAEGELAERLSNGESEKALADLIETAKERGGHDNITGVVVDVLELAVGADGVPAAVEHDETLPVDVSKGWSDDENTESLSVKDAARLEQTEPLPRIDPREVADVATRPTAPMPAVTPPSGDAPAAESAGERDAPTVDLGPVADEIRRRAGIDKASMAGGAAAAPAQAPAAETGEAAATTDADDTEDGDTSGPADDTATTS